MHLPYDSRPIIRIIEQLRYGIDMRPSLEVRLSENESVLSVLMGVEASVDCAATSAAGCRRCECHVEFHSKSRQAVQVGCFEESATIAGEVSAQVIGYEEVDVFLFESHCGELKWSLRAYLDSNGVLYILCVGCEQLRD